MTRGPVTSSESHGGLRTNPGRPREGGGLSCRAGGNGYFWHARDGCPLAPSPLRLPGPGGLPPASGRSDLPSSRQVPVLKPMDLMVEVSPRRVFANGHTYHINSISVNSDCETYMSADDLRINLWHLAITDRSFSILSRRVAPAASGWCWLVCKELAGGLLLRSPPVSPPCVSDAQT